MKVKEFFEKHGCCPQYSANYRAFKSHMDCEILGYLVIGVKGISRMWCIIYRGPKKVWCFINGRRNDPSKGKLVIDSFHSNADVYISDNCDSELTLLNV